MPFFNPFSPFEDPFSSSRNIFRQMDQMMGGMMDPFANDPFFRGSFPPLMGPPIARDRPAENPLQVTPFGNLFGAMGSLENGDNCHVFSSSSVMTMQTGPDGRPQVYQATSSSRGGPGGVRETQQSVIDSSQGIRKMKIGRHINDRVQVMEKEMGPDGALEEHQELVNLDEDDLNQFNREFDQRSRFGYRRHGRDDYLKRVDFADGGAASSQSSSRHQDLPALPAPESHYGKMRKDGSGGKSRSPYSR